jgi:hypothetical protein
LIQAEPASFGVGPVVTDASMTWMDATELIGKFNRTLRGWANYFKVDKVRRAYRDMPVRRIDLATLARWWATTETRIAKAVFGHASSLDNCQLSKLHLMGACGKE